jgi:3-methyladenine DNA glycosylase AlkD
MTSAQQTLERLKAKAQPDQLQGMARYGMAVDNRLGVKVPELRKLAKEIGRDHRLAQDLWATGIAEARILASMVDVPAVVSEEQMEAWAQDFDSWDVCDQVCMNLFEKTPLAWEKIPEWSRRQEEFVKRGGYALLACLAWHDKKATDERFIALLPVILEGADDPRNYVKKAVSWALRNIGKRNSRLRQAALDVAQQLADMDSKIAHWISADTIRDLNSIATRRRLERSVED